MPGSPDVTLGRLNRESSESSWQVIVLNSVFTTSLPPLHLQPLCEKRGSHSGPPPNTHTSLPPYGALAGVWEAHASTPLEPSLSPCAQVPPVPIYSINSFPHYVYPFTWLLCFLIPLMFIICPTGSTDFASCRASRL